MRFKYFRQTEPMYLIFLYFLSFPGLTADDDISGLMKLMTSRYEVIYQKKYFYHHWIQSIDPTNAFVKDDTHKQMGSSAGRYKIDTSNHALQVLKVDFGNWPFCRADTMRG